MTLHTVYGECPVCVSADCALSFSALRDLGSWGVSVDGHDDREAGARTPGQPLRLREAGGRLLLLVPRHCVAQEGVPGRRRPLVTRQAWLPTVWKINVNDSIDIQDNNIIFLIKKGKANVSNINCRSENNLQPLSVFVVREHSSQRKRPRHCSFWTEEVRRFFSDTALL